MGKKRFCTVCGKEVITDLISIEGEMACQECAKIILKDEFQYPENSKHLSDLDTERDIKPVKTIEDYKKNHPIWYYILLFLEIGIKISFLLLIILIIYGIIKIGGIAGLFSIILILGCGIWFFCWIFGSETDIEKCIRKYLNK